MLKISARSLAFSDVLQRFQTTPQRLKNVLETSGQRPGHVFNVLQRFSKTLKMPKGRP